MLVSAAVALAVAGVRRRLLIYHMCAGEQAGQKRDMEAKKREQTCEQGSVCMRVRVRVRVRVCACLVRARARVCVRVRVRARARAA